MGSSFFSPKLYSDAHSPLESSVLLREHVRSVPPNEVASIRRRGRLFFERYVSLHNISERVRDLVSE